MMGIDEHVHRFREFLASAWPTLAKEVLEAPNLLDDWKQANWEVLVEAPFRAENDNFLEVYGDGADCNGSSSRVWRPEAETTHRLACFPKMGAHVRDCLTRQLFDPVPFTFDRFVTWDAGQYAEAPPFAHVRLESRTDSQRIVAATEIRFAAISCE